MAMHDLPDRPALTRLLTAARDVLPTGAVGFVRPADQGHVYVLLLSDQGVGAHVSPAHDAPAALRPGGTGLVQTGPEALSAFPDRSPEWQLRFHGVQRVLSLPVPGDQDGTRVWVGAVAGDDPPAAVGHALAGLAALGADVLRAEATPAEQLERLRRLDRASDLVPALLEVLDVRDVFARLSDTAQRALPHDLLLLREFSDDMTTARVYALSDRGPVAGPPVSHGYPVSVIKAWEYSIVDDLAAHPIEAEAPLAKLGARSVLRLAIKFDHRTIGGLAFLSRSPAAFTTTDLLVARRLADHVAVALSHHRMAEERRAAAALRERTANLEMLDGLLAALAGVLDVRAVFERVSDVAQAVLPHDGLSILELLDGGARARVHASHGLGELPEVLDIPTPQPALSADAVDTRIVEDYRDRPEYSSGPGARAGMRSSLFVSIHLEGKVFGGVNFYSRTPGRFTKNDVLVARRVTDHIALALSHHRLAEQVRITEELRSRAASLDLLDALLLTIRDDVPIGEAFQRLSGIARRVLPHDSTLLGVFSADRAQMQRYFSSDFDDLAAPRVVAVPEEMRNDHWDHVIVDDMSVNPTEGMVEALKQGFRSGLRMAVHLDGRVAATLVFLKRALRGFTPADVTVGRRLADRLALRLSHERGFEATRRAEEATERAARLESRVRALTDELDARTGYRRVIGDSPQWRQVLTQATQVAATETTALLLGESGTGKEVVARFVHRASPRKGGPFLALNCAALPEQLLEAELFGYERGAFTGAVQSKPGQLEQAAGGTLFLDEVGEMSPTAQAKFLRVLQEREFQRLGGTRVLRSEARIVAATNRDLPRAIASGQFREDLYYRLNVFAIRLPPLRDRKADIPTLSEAFLTEIGKGLGRPPGGISRDARELLVAYHWPGNVRELRNVLERAAILCEGGLITADLLGISSAAASDPIAAPAPGVGAVPVPVPLPPPVASAPTGAGAPASAGDLAGLEKTMIENALAAARFNKSKAAKALGMTRHQLYIRMRKHGLE
ncbi:MAG: sigma 54-interacting transcriptional regulator [Vicinamibacterales bacterium]